jgi:hypothetical protein
VADRDLESDLINLRSSWKGVTFVHCTMYRRRDTHSLAIWVKVYVASVTVTDTSFYLLNGKAFINHIVDTIGTVPYKYKTCWSRPAR